MQEVLAKALRLQAYERYAADLHDLLDFMFGKGGGQEGGREAGREGGREGGRREQKQCTRGGVKGQSSRGA